jgi:hypothetical protein
LKVVSISAMRAICRPRNRDLELFDDGEPNKPLPGVAIGSRATNAKLAMEECVSYSSDSHAGYTTAHTSLGTRCPLDLPIATAILIAALNLLSWG